MYCTFYHVHNSTVLVLVHPNLHTLYTLIGERYYLHIPNTV